VRLGLRGRRPLPRLGIGEYSDESRASTRASSRRRLGRPLLEVDLGCLPGLHDPPSPRASPVGRRVARADCRSATSSTRRDRSRLRGGRHRPQPRRRSCRPLGNVLRWDTGYLGRQHPVLPATPGFVRKVKPWCGWASADRRHASCRASTIRWRSAPMGRRQPPSGLQGGAQRARGAFGRASKAAFLLASSSVASERFAGDAEHERDEAGGGRAGPAGVCAARPRRARCCAFCRLRFAVGAITLDADALARGSAEMTRLFAAASASYSSTPSAADTS